MTGVLTRVRRPPLPPVRPGRPKVAAAAVAAVVVLAAVGYSLQGDHPFARLRVLSRAVEVRGAGASWFAQGRDRQALANGDSIRTDDSGRAQLDYFDGSLTRLDHRTTFDLLELVRRERLKVIGVRLPIGRTWHRVAKLTSSQDRFEVRTSNAVATVRGTTFLVDCTPQQFCTFTVIDGAVEVVTTSGERILLEAGQSVTVSPDGRAGALQRISVDRLRQNDQWVDLNLRLDEQQRRSGGGPGALPAGGGGGTSPSTSTGASTTTTLPPGRGAGPGAEDGGAPQPGGTVAAGIGPGVALAARPGNGTEAQPASEEPSEQVPVAPREVPQPGPVARPTPTPPTAPTPSRNGLIAFSGRMSSSDVSGIFVVNPDGTGLRQLRTGGSRALAWSPDGRRLLFDRQVGEPTRRTHDIFVMNADGGGEVMLTNHPADDWGAAWSPDGSRIVFSSDRGGGEHRLYTMAADGSDVAPLTSGDLGQGTDDFSPHWSPDGSKIVFSRGVPTEGSGNSAIFSINADGSGLTRLTPPPPAARGRIIEPKWSPDGTQIVTGNGSSACSARVYVMNADGSDIREMPHGDACLAAGASWAPEADKIVYSLLRAFEGVTEDGLYTVKPDGSGFTRLLPGVEAGTTDWQRTPTSQSG